MWRTYQETVYFRNRTEKSLKAFRKQKKICSRLYKKERKKFFNSLNPSLVKDSKFLWKTIKSFFSNKGDSGLNIQLVEGSNLLQDYRKIAGELNTFFKTAVSNFNINENTYIINHDSENLSDPVNKAICKKFHPSILLTKSKLENQARFPFQPISKFDIEKEIKNIDLKKTTTKNTILPKILKVSCNTSAENLQNLFNECLITGNLPNNLKLADITPIFKKKDPLNEENYRPVMSYLVYLKFLKNLCRSKQMLI